MRYNITSAPFYAIGFILLFKKKLPLKNNLFTKREIRKHSKSKNKYVRVSNVPMRIVNKKPTKFSENDKRDNGEEIKQYPFFKTVVPAIIKNKKKICDVRQRIGTDETDHFVDVKIMNEHLFTYGLNRAPKPTKNLIKRITLSQARKNEPGKKIKNCEINHKSDSPKKEIFYDLPVKRVFVFKESN